MIRSTISGTPPVNCPSFGRTMAPPCPSPLPVAMSPTLINSVTRRLSVSTQTGSVNCPSLLPYKIVSENGNPKSCQNSRSSLAWLSLLWISMLSVSTSPPKSQLAVWQRGQQQHVHVPPSSARPIFSLPARSLVVTRLVLYTCTSLFFVLFSPKIAPQGAWPHSLGTSFRLPPSSKCD